MVSLRSSPQGATVHRTVAFLVFKSLAPKTKNSHAAKAVCEFLAGAQGLEPWAYGFGDRRSTN